MEVNISPMSQENNILKELPIPIPLPIDTTPLHKIGNINFIFQKRKRVCGPNNSILIGTYILITIPTLVYSILV